MRYVLSLLFVASTWADFLTTYVLLRTHRGAYEANPLAAWVLFHHGWTGMAVMVGLTDLTVLVLLHIAWRKKQVSAAIGFGTACLMSNAVVIHNLAQLASLVP